MKTEARARTGANYKRAGLTFGPAWTLLDVKAIEKDKHGSARLRSISTDPHIDIRVDGVVVVRGGKEVPEDEVAIARAALEKTASSSDEETASLLAKCADLEADLALARQEHDAEKTALVEELDALKAERKALNKELDALKGGESKAAKKIALEAEAATGDKSKHPDSK